VPQVQARQQETQVPPVAQALTAIRVTQATQVQVRLRVTPVAQAAQALMVMQVIQVMLVQVPLMARRVLRVMLVLQVMLVRQEPQARALHRVMLGRSMLADQVMQARQLQPTVQMQLKSGHSSRFRSRLVAGARQAKLPSLGDGPR